MTFFKSISTQTRLIKKSLLSIAALSLAFPTVGFAQTQSASPVSRPVLEDGTYLFGQSPQPNEIGSAYAVLSVQNNQTVGAFYYPRSSFACFSGQVTHNNQAVNVVDSYDQTVYPYEIALTVDSTLVAGDAAGAYALEGFHRIETLSAQDIEILGVCEADFNQ